MLSLLLRNQYHERHGVPSEIPYIKSRFRPWSQDNAVSHYPRYCTTHASFVVHVYVCAQVSFWSHHFFRTPGSLVVLDKFVIRQARNGCEHQFAYEDSSQPTSCSTGANCCNMSDLANKHGSPRDHVAISEIELQPAVIDLQLDCQQASGHLYKGLIKISGFGATSVLPGDPCDHVVISETTHHNLYQWEMLDWHVWVWLLCVGSV
jgi:hypothetical protein